MTCCYCFFNNFVGGIFGNHAPPTQKGSALEEFGYDLTKLAAEGKLDPVIGREEEIRRTIQGYLLRCLNIFLL